MARSGSLGDKDWGSLVNLGVVRQRGSICPVVPSCELARSYLLVCRPGWLASYRWCRRWTGLVRVLWMIAADGSFSSSDAVVLAGSFNHRDSLTTLARSMSSDAVYTPGSFRVVGLSGHMARFLCVMRSGQVARFPLMGVPRRWLNQR